MVKRTDGVHSGERVLVEVAGGAWGFVIVEIVACRYSRLCGFKG